MTELSLDISQRDISQYDLEASVELKPDVCAYRKRPVVPAGKNDLIKVSQMPDLVVEILSPRQSIDYLIRKTKAYFELGVKNRRCVGSWFASLAIGSMTTWAETFGRNHRYHRLSLLYSSRFSWKALD